MDNIHDEFTNLFEFRSKVNDAFLEFEIRHDMVRAERLPDHLAVGLDYISIDRTEYEAYQKLTEKLEKLLKEVS